MARLSFPQRVLLVLLLAVVLAAPAAMGAQPRPRAEDRQSDLLSELASALRVQFWSLLTRSWEKEGCGIDPHGGCTKSAADKTDEGCIADPHGGCGH